MQNEATKLGHEAAQIAADHADKVNDNWSTTAYQLFCEYAKTHDKFMTEQVAFYYPEFEKPPSGRAWGWVAILAQKNGIVKHCDYKPTTKKTAHGARATLWESQILDIYTKCKIEFEQKYK